jgi:hypothetical protein
MEFKRGTESVLLRKIADVILLAGTDELAIVDSFSAGLPIIAAESDTYPLRSHICATAKTRSSPLIILRILATPS